MQNNRPFFKHKIIIFQGKFSIISTFSKTKLSFEVQFVPPPQDDLRHHELGAGTFSLKSINYLD